MLISSELLLAQTGFKNQQMQYERVKTAYKEKEKMIINELKTKKLSLTSIEIMLLAFKKERILELWVKQSTQNEYELIKTYQFSAFSGKLGPKRKQGDNQIPEGFYFIDRFNPTSNFYLSLGVSYPNNADKIKSKANDLGGDVFIHGNSVTIGCIPITDDKIKELYIYAVEAKNNAQKNIPVYIFPARLTSQNYTSLKKEFSTNEALLLFWQNLKEGYDFILNNKKEPKVTVDKNGNYIISAK